MITQADRVRGLRQSQVPPTASWLLPLAFLVLALGRLTQVHALANKFNVGTGDVISLLRLSESQRLARVFRGYEVAIIQHMISAAMLLAFCALLAFILWLWRSNARAQARLWGYVAELEKKDLDLR